MIFCIVGLGFGLDCYFPVYFISSQSTTAEGFRQCAKNLYDLTKSEEENKNDTALPELIVQGFDDEQVIF